jgi:hypothetical protein
VASEGHVAEYGAILATSAAKIPDVYRLLFFPLHLSFDYEIHPLEGFADPSARIGASLLAAWLVAALGLLIYRKTLVAFSMLWLVLTYVPYAQIIPVNVFFLAERYLYLPSFGACLLVALGFARALVLAEKRDQAFLKGAALFVLVILLSAGGARSALRNRDWRDNLSLGLSASAAGIETWRVQQAIGEGRLRQADYANSTLHLRRAVVLEPRSPSIRYWLAASLVFEGRVDEASQEIEIAVSQWPQGGPSELMHSMYVLSRAYLSQDMKKAAAWQLRRSLDTRGAYQAKPKVLESLAWILAVSPELKLLSEDEAILKASQAVTKSPDRNTRALLALAAAHASTGDFERALTNARLGYDAAAAMHAEDEMRLAQVLADTFEERAPYRLDSRELLALLRP